MPGPEISTSLTSDAFRIEYFSLADGRALRTAPGANTNGARAQAETLIGVYAVSALGVTMSPPLSKLF